MDTRIHVLKFIELGTENEFENKLNNAKQKADSKHQQNDQGQQKSEEIVVVAPVENRVLPNVQGSEKESQNSSTSLNEDLRLIKDFKNLMNEKSQARNIKFLKRTVIFLGLSLVFLSSVELAFKIIQNDDVASGEDIIYNSFMRTNLLGDVIFYCRMLDLLGRGIYLPRNMTNDAAETSFKDTVIIYLTSIFCGEAF